MMTFEDIIRMADAGDVAAMVVAIQEFVWNMDPKHIEDEFVRGKVIDYLMMAIDSGSAEAMNQLGAMYAEGRLVVKDPVEAFRWYKAASEKGFDLATSNLGFCYLYGKGTEQNYEEAYKAFSKAAMMGIGDAVVRMGDMFSKGLFVEKDQKAALRMYFSARDIAYEDLDDFGMQQVYSDAMLRIGNCHYFGEGTEKDLTYAVHCYADALHFFELREKRGDDYSSAGYNKTKEMLLKAVSEL